MKGFTRTFLKMGAEDEAKSIPCFKKAVFKHSLECHYGLLDHLLSNECLAADVVNDLKQRLNSEACAKLVDLISESNVDKFEHGLEESNQCHLANFIKKNGIRESTEDDEWPLLDSDIAFIRRCYPALVRDLDYKSLLDLLIKEKCLSSEQVSTILSKGTTEARNRELLDTLMRRSLRQFNIFLTHLRCDQANQHVWLQLSESIDHGYSQLAEDSSLGVDVTLPASNRLHVVTKPVEESHNSRHRLDDVLDNFKEFVKRALRKDVGPIWVLSITQVRKPSSYNEYLAVKEVELTPRSKLQIMNPNNGSIRGVTVVHREIFVVRAFQSHVDVYDSYSLTTSHEIEVPGLKLPQCLAGCAFNGALFINDNKLEDPQIHRVYLRSNSTKSWRLNHNQVLRGLSVTPGGTALVTVEIRDTGGESRVVEYSSEGTKIREISLDESIKYAYQTVQLSYDQLIVSHGSASSLHRICEIDTGGKIMKTFGDNKGCSDSQLNRPIALTVSENGKRIFIADCHNCRILLLDGNLAYLGKVSTPRDLENPYRLYLDSASDKLFLGEEHRSRLLVISSPDILNY